MYFSKDIENFGTGLKRIADAYDEACVRVEFELLKKGFSVVFYQSDEQFNMTEKMSNDQINVQISVQLNKTEQ